VLGFTLSDSESDRQSPVYGGLWFLKVENEMRYVIPKIFITIPRALQGLAIYD